MATASQCDERDGKEVKSSKQPSADTRPAKYLPLYGLQCPTSEEEVITFVSLHKLSHGDVVAFSDYRDTDSHIVFERDDGTISLIPNPDDRDAGYLTIPKEVTSKVTDALDLYRDFIHEDQAAFNLYLSPEDKFVVDRLGQVPSDWLFALNYDWGELSEFSIQVPGYEWETLHLLLANILMSAIFQILHPSPFA